MPLGSHFLKLSWLQIKFSTNAYGRKTSTYDIRIRNDIVKMAHTTCMVSCGNCADDAGYKASEGVKEGDGGWKIVEKILLAIVSKACPKCLSSVYLMHTP